MKLEELNIIECIQGSPEWLQARMGMLGSSTIADAIAKRKRGGTEELRCRYNLRLELAVERLTNRTMEHYVSQWMERGTELEPLARAAYELRTGVDTVQVGFVLHPDRDGLRWAGCSPDSLVGDDGLCEFKCPKGTTHAEYILGDCVPADYRDQIMWQMACTGREWCDFISFHPDFPDGHDLFICRLPRDNDRIAEMEKEARIFLAEVDAMVIRLKSGIAGALEASIEREAAR